MGKRTDDGGERAEEETRKNLTSKAAGRNIMTGLARCVPRARGRHEADLRPPFQRRILFFKTREYIKVYR